MRVAVIGAGSWGTTVAALACVNTPTILWARRAALAATITAGGGNPDYLPGVGLPDALVATSDLAAAVSSCDVLVMGVPAKGFRDVLREAAPWVRPWVPVVSLAKGLEASSLLRMSEVVAEVLPGHPVAALTGPNLAREIMAGQPAASVVAGADATVAAELQRIFSTPSLRIYTNTDLIGCEISGVVKNVMAIAAGMAAGMGFGDNTRATLVTRGLAEMARLGTALGADRLTFAGLAGMGDLIATCSSQQSRNFTVGRLLGEGRAIGDITSSMSMVAEGVQSSSAVLELAGRHGVEMPLTEAVAAVCHHGLPAADAVRRLMNRDTKSEQHGLGA
jgi:glycerol-3-phosphate dehydrogenase (NAD(P)+)